MPADEERMLGLGGDNNWDGPWWQIAAMAVGIVLLTFTLIALVMWPTVIRPAQRARRLRMNGHLTQAWVRSVTPRAIRVGHQGGYRFKLEVDSPSGRYPVVLNDLVDMIHAPFVSAGKRVMVRVDVRHADRVAIDWDATVEAATREPVGSLGVR